MLFYTMHYASLVLANGFQTKVSGWLAKHYSSPKEAEAHYCRQVIQPKHKKTDGSERNSSADAQGDDTDTPTLIVHLFTELTVEN